VSNPSPPASFVSNQSYRPKAKWLQKGTQNEDQRTATMAAADALLSTLSRQVLANDIESAKISLTQLKVRVVYLLFYLDLSFAGRYPSPSHFMLFDCCMMTPLTYPPPLSFKQMHSLQKLI